MMLPIILFSGKTSRTPEEVWSFLQRWVQGTSDRNMERGGGGGHPGIIGGVNSNQSVWRALTGLLVKRCPTCTRMLTIWKECDLYHVSDRQECTNELQFYKSIKPYWCSLFSLPSRVSTHPPPSPLALFHFFWQKTSFCIPMSFYIIMFPGSCDASVNKWNGSTLVPWLQDHMFHVTKQIE